MIDLVVPVYPVNEEVAETARRALTQADGLAGVRLITVINTDGVTDELPGDIRIYQSATTYSSAVNLGLRWATADWVAVGSHDILIPDGWAEASKAETVVCPINRADSPHPFWGGLWTMPRACFEAVGMLDETMDRISDQDYAIRCHQAGYPSRRIPIEVTHLRSAANDYWDRPKVRREHAKFRAKYGCLSYTAWAS